MADLKTFFVHITSFYECKGRILKKCAALPNVSQASQGLSCRAGSVLYALESQPQDTTNKKRCRYSPTRKGCYEGSSETRQALVALLYISMTHNHFFSGSGSHKHVLDKSSLLSIERWQSTEHYYTAAATTLKKLMLTVL